MLSMKLNPLAANLCSNRQETELRPFGSQAPQDLLLRRLRVKILTNQSAIGKSLGGTFIMRLGRKPKNEPAEPSKSDEATPVEAKPKRSINLLGAITAPFGLLRTLTLTIVWAALAVLALITGFVAMAVAATSPTGSLQVTMTWDAFVILVAGFLFLALLDLAKDGGIALLQRFRS